MKKTAIKLVLCGAISLASLAANPLMADESQATLSAADWYSLGISSYSTGDYSQAVNELGQAATLQPDVNTLFYLGYCQQLLGQNEAAAAAYIQALALSQDDANWQYELGTRLESLGYTNEALIAYARAMELKPDDADLAYSIGIHYFSLGNYKAAIPGLKRAAKLHPDANTYFYLGYCYYLSGKNIPAANAYKKALKLVPDDAAWQYQLSINLYYAGDIKTAIKAASRAVKLAPSAEYYNFLGTLLSAMGDEEEASAAFEEAQKLQQTETEQNPDEFDPEDLPEHI